MTRAAALVSSLLMTAAVHGQPIPKIEHSPIGCVLKDRFARVTATVEPATSAAHVRLYFTSSAGDDYYAVEMTLVDGRFVAKLPKPKDKASPITYFVEVQGTGGEVQRTPETQVIVVKKHDACPTDQRLADEADAGDMVLQAQMEKPAKPRGFSGVARVEPMGGVASASPPPAESRPSPTAPPVPLAVPTPEAPRPTPPPPPTEFALGPEDIIKVTVIGHEDLSPTLVVQTDGTAIFPLLGKIKVADLTPKQLERRLAELLAKGYIRNPQVSIAVQEYKSKTVMVMGEVSRPGPYPMTPNMRIVELLARAGMNVTGATQVQVIRPLIPTDRPLLPAEVAGDQTGRQAEVMKVDLRAIQGGDLDKNMALLPNDTVFVPPAAKFFVTGETRNTGAFTFQPGLTIREAVILAGGFSDNASSGRLRVIREVEGKRKELKTKPDDLVQPGDIIVVKGKLF